MIIRNLFSLAIFILDFIEFIVFTIVIYFLSFLPHRFIKHVFPYAFRFWRDSLLNVLGITVNIHQKQAAKNTQPDIIICNHPSIIENLMLPSLIEHFCPVISSHYQSIFFFNRIINLFEPIYVNIEQHDALNIVKIKEALLAGKQLLILPEAWDQSAWSQNLNQLGNRLAHCFKTGAFDIAVNSKCNISPIYVQLESQLDFSWRSTDSIYSCLFRMFKSSNKTVNFYLFDSIDSSKFNSGEELRDYTYKLYTEWQDKYMC